MAYRVWRCVSFMLNVIYAECHLCWVSQISPLCWVSLCSVSLCWVLLCWMSLRWVSLCWMSWRLFYSCFWAYLKHFGSSLQKCERILRVYVYVSLVRPSLIFAGTTSDLWPYSQHFIFFVTREFVEWARVLAPTKLFYPSTIKHSTLLGPFVS